MVWVFLIGVVAGAVGTLGVLWLVILVYTQRANRQPAEDPDATVGIPRIR